MFLRVEPNSAEPLYQQMAHQIRLRIAGGQLLPGEALPSARELAAQLKVNFLTVTKVYQILEREGLVEMRRGSGTYVADQRSSSLSKTRQDLLEELAESLAEGARQMGFDPDDVVRILRQKMKKKD